MNRIVGSVVIVDSAMGNNNLLDATSGGNVVKYWDVNTVMLSMVDTSASLVLCGANTAADQLMRLDKYNPMVHFSQPVRFYTLKVPVATNATGWIYLA